MRQLMNNIIVLAYLFGCVRIVCVSLFVCLLCLFLLHYFYIIKKFVYPENVALPIGGERNDKYLLIEIHYDNPRMESGNNSLYLPY